MRGNERKTIAVIAACVVISGALSGLMPGVHRGMASSAQESFAGTEAAQEDIASDGSQNEASEAVVLEDEFGVKLLDSSAAADDEAADVWSSPADEAGAAAVAETMAVTSWNSKHYFSWNIYFYDTVFSPQFRMSSGQYLNIAATFTPAGANGYVCYMTPDKVVHMLSSSSTTNKTIKVTQTGYYRVGFCNRGMKTVKLTGYYRISK